MKWSCELIQDLLPLYADQSCSVASQKAVEEHICNCDACRSMLQAFRTPLPSTPMIPEETKHDMRLFRRLRWLYLELGLTGAALLIGWVIFLGIALSNPQAHLPVKLEILYLIYSAYGAVTSALLAASCVLRPGNRKANDRIKAYALCFTLGWSAFGLGWISYFVSCATWGTVLYRSFEILTPILFLLCLGLMLIGAVMFLNECVNKKVNHLKNKKGS